MKRSKRSQIAPQKATDSVGGCLSGPRPADLVRGGMMQERASSVTCEVAPTSDLMDSAMGNDFPAQGSYENSAMSIAYTATREEVVRIFRQNLSIEDERKQIKLIFLKSDESVTDELLYKLNSIIITERSNYTKKLNRCYRTYKKFKIKFAEHLKEEIELRHEIIKNSHRGRPLLSYEEKGERSKQNEAIEFAKTFDDVPLSKILKTVEVIAKQKGKNLLAKAIRELQKHPELSSSEASNETNTTSTRSYSGEEALALIIDCDLSVDDYKCIRSGAKTHGANIYPSYHEVLAAKTNCRPKEPHEIS